MNAAAHLAGKLIRKQINERLSPELKRLARVRACERKARREPEGGR